jgi:hypothetical protein
MAEFTGTKLVTANQTPKSLIPSGAPEKAAPVDGFKPAVWQLSKSK